MEREYRVMMSDGTRELLLETLWEAAEQMRQDGPTREAAAGDLAGLCFIPVDSDRTAQRAGRGD